MADWLERNRRLVLAALLNVSLIGAVIFGARYPRPAPLVIQTATPAPTATEAPCRVYVSGAVARPDVYALPSGSIGKDAVAAAGGPSAEADLAQVNLALPVRDGDQVHVPAKGEMPPSRSLSVQEGKVNINQASAAELETLPGIGAVYAQRIVEYRQAHGSFKTIQELGQVQGIGPATIEKIKPLITLR
ncbi:MAG: ComEA family DNA-binding protein [Chloroflexi bacterium]|nr:ComEA family DNA-binding protein [Chloroflexota bacterium]